MIGFLAASTSAHARPTDTFPPFDRIGNRRVDLLAVLLEQLACDDSEDLRARARFARVPKADCHHGEDVRYKADILDARQFPSLYKRGGRAELPGPAERGPGPHVLWKIRDS